MPFDLDTIILHLDNFATTWKSWNTVFTGLDTFFNGKDDKDGALEVL